jgi:membrane protein YqaA with SNARE-associated domain
LRTSAHFKHLQALLLGMGPLGLFLTGIVDSSSIPFPVELLLIPLTMAEPSRLLWYVTLATLGSTIGSTILFGLARRFGGHWVEKKIPPRTFRRIHAAFENYDVMAVAVPAMMPPGFPFKFFVLVAGLFEMSWAHFVLTMFVGRYVRYFLEAWLALRYGGEFVTLVKQHPLMAVLIVVLLVAGGYLIGRLRAQRHPAVQE